jgi:hypothetical protein
MRFTSLALCAVYAHAGTHATIDPPPDDYRDWRWQPNLDTPVRYAIEQSEWPTFLTYKAWDSCQGCKSASSGDLTKDVSAESFQVKGDWMRVSSRRAGEGVTLSTHASPQTWLNPPRRNTDDTPLEFEWFQYFDVPQEWGWQGLLGDLTEVRRVGERCVRVQHAFETIKLTATSISRR